MAAQQHKIMRQVLEARDCPLEAAPRVRSELRGTYYQRLLPLIEKVCSNLSTPGRVHRIDSLEIDLGEVPLEALESALAGKFEAVFSRELAAAIGGAPPIDSALELFSYFVGTGTVPWWADLSERALLEKSLEDLIRRAPQALRRAMQATPDAERMRRRIARAYPDRLLDDLAGVMAPSLSAACPGLGTAWVTTLGSVSAARGHPPHGARNLWWEELLRALGAGSTAASEAPRFFQAILRRVARRLGIEYPLLIAELRRALGEGALPARLWARDVAESLWRELTGDGVKPRESILLSESDRPRESVPPRASVPPRESASLRGSDPLRESAPRSEPALLSESVRAQLMRLISRLRVRLQAQAIAAFEAAGGGATLDGETMDALVAQVHLALEQKHVAPELGAELLAALRDPARAQRQEDVPVDLRFSDADEIYVENAGLVILWPFLTNFFTGLDLVEEKAFKDAAAKQRAAGLLQYLATGEAPAPEHLLPLNKLLCGMPLEEVFDFGAPMSNPEIEACDDLLGAAIQQAPILREMSIAGFRASFLLRKGQLGSRDGNWLLRVERETHDVVLDRFPWSVHLVKLPWMEAIMQVEW